jgi:hypothetical protein
LLNVYRLGMVELNPFSLVLLVLYGKKLPLEVVTF